MAEFSRQRLRQGDFDNKLTSFNKWITSNKRKTFKSSKETK